MRVTQKVMTNNAGLYASGNLERLYEIQDKIASGKKYTQPSDDPTGASRALQLRSTRQANDAYLETAERAELWITATEINVKELVSAASRAGTMINSALSDTQGPTERAAVRDEIKALINQVVNIGNATHLDKYIFNGYNVDAATEPYQLDQTRLADPTYNPVTPSDAGQNIIQKYGPGQYVTLNFSGQESITPLLNGLIHAYRALYAESQGLPFDRDALIVAQDEVIKATNVVKTTWTTVGTRQREISDGIDVLKRMDVEIAKLLNKNEDLDMAQAATELAARQLAYQTSLQVSTKVINNPTMFDYVS